MLILLKKYKNVSLCNLILCDFAKKVFFFSLINPRDINYIACNFRKLMHISIKSGARGTKLNNGLARVWPSTFDVLRVDNIIMSHMNHHNMRTLEIQIDAIFCFRRIV